MAGVLSYIAFMLILFVWAVGWLAIAVLIGSLLKVPPKVSTTSGLILGPLGVLYVVLLGVTSKDWRASAGRTKERVERVVSSARRVEEAAPAHDSRGRAPARAAGRHRHQRRDSNLQQVTREGSGDDASQKQRVETGAACRRPTAAA